MKFLMAIFLISFSIRAQEADSKNQYRLYPTENIWNLLLLNTYDGRVWQVQFSVEGYDKRFSVPIGSKRIINNEKSRNGRFELVKTQNMYNFLLLDRDKGNIWQVQWGTDAGNEGIWTIHIEEHWADRLEYNKVVYSKLSSTFKLPDLYTFLSIMKDDSIREGFRKDILVTSKWILNIDGIDISTSYMFEKAVTNPSALFDYFDSNVLNDFPKLRKHANHLFPVFVPINDSLNEVKKDD